jgi:hypothetical protein
MDEGEFAEAALAFHDLAKKAEGMFPERAPFLYIEAGHAATLNGDGKKAVTCFRSGLTLLGTQQRHLRLRKAGRRIVAELREHGFNAEADEVESVVETNSTVWGKADAPEPKQHPILPTHCPSCGAAVRSDEVDWIDDLTAECDYCGSPVRAES